MTFTVGQKLMLYVKMELENATEVRPSLNFQYVMNVSLPFKGSELPDCRVGFGLVLAYTCCSSADSMYFLS